MKRAAIFFAPIVVVACQSNHFGGDGGPFDKCLTPSDCDGDGFSSAQDCNDHDPNVNPNAYDFPGNGVDDDCDGTIDNAVTSCETVPQTAPGSPTDFARAVDLCAQPHYDPLLQAAWGEVQGYGGQTIWTSGTRTSQVNIVSSFGDNAPRRGKTMIGLASGIWNVADPRNDPPLDPTGFQLDNACADIPLTTADCEILSNGAPAGGVNVEDWAELTVWVRAPSNAHAIAIDYSFFSTEFNQYWGGALNDAFLVLVSSKDFHGDDVAKLANGNGITVNSGLFQLCPPPPGPSTLSSDKSSALAACVNVAGDPNQNVFGSLKGTYYDGASVAPYDGTAKSFDGTHTYLYGGGTGWITTSFPVTPGDSIQIRIAVFDVFDGLRDSAVLVDAIRWLPEATQATGRPPN